MFAMILDFIVKSLSSRGNVAREGRGRAICAKGWHRKQTTEGESRGATMHRTIDTSYRYRVTILYRDTRALYQYATIHCAIFYLLRNIAQ